MANVELSPCPFCGTANDKHVGLIITQTAETNTGDFAVKCLGCGAWGPYGASNRALAVEFWNKRRVVMPMTITDAEGKEYTSTVTWHWGK